MAQGDLSQSDPAGRWEDLLLAAVLAMMIALPLIEVVGRFLLGRGIAGSIPIVQHLTLWATFLGAAQAARRGRLLAMATPAVLPQSLSKYATLFTTSIGICICLSLGLSSSVYLMSEFESKTELAWGIPLWAALIIMPAAYVWIAWRLECTNSPGISRWAAGLVGIALLAAAAAISGLATSGTRWMGVALIGAATLLGLPIFASLGGVALLLFWTDGNPVSSVAFDAYRLTAHPILPAIPLFTVAGYVLAEGGASRRLLRTFTALAGWMPGGLAIVSTLLLAFFTPLTGASGVTILSIGGLLFPLLVKAGYPGSTSMGLVTVSGSIGLLLPPSLPVILYAVSARLPIDEMFIAGLLPGLLLIAVVVLYGAGRGVVARVPRTPFRVAEGLHALWESKWDLLLPVLAFATYFAGGATLVETAALTVLGSVIIEFLIHQGLAFEKDGLRIAVECGMLIGGFLIILASALGFTNYLVQVEAPVTAMQWVRSHITSPAAFLLALNLFLVVVGALMDIYSAIFVLVPLLAPIGAAYGVDPVHLGIIFLANMELGYLMPPMGENLFLSAYRFKQPLSHVYLSTLPFLLLIALAVLVITYAPSLSLALLERRR